MYDTISIMTRELKGNAGGEQNGGIECETTGVRNNGTVGNQRPRSPVREDDGTAF